MSVRRKGPRATAVRVLTYAVLVAVAVVVVFPFVVAVATSTKNSQDIFNYPPTLIPRENQTVEAAEVGLDGDPIPLYTFPDTDAKLRAGRQRRVGRRVHAARRPRSGSSGSRSASGVEDR